MLPRCSCPLPQKKAWRGDVSEVNLELRAKSSSKKGRKTSRHKRKARVSRLPMVEPMVGRDVVDIEDEFELQHAAKRHCRHQQNNSQSEEGLDGPSSDVKLGLEARRQTSPIPRPSSPSPKRCKTQQKSLCLRSGWALAINLGVRVALRESSDHRGFSAREQQ